jgi:N-acyl-D-aspartate/D-glutamate deacylase
LGHIAESADLKCKISGVFGKIANFTKHAYKSIIMRLIACLICFAFSCSLLWAQKPEYDLVISGGRVIDPETKLDAVCNIGIQQGRIAMISTELLRGKEQIKAQGLVVAPGFIDMHIHGVSNVEQEYQVHDGITTALELEAGIPYLDQWLASRKNKALINYGSSVNWVFSRMQAMSELSEDLKAINDLAKRGEIRFEELNNLMGASFSKVLGQDEVPKMLQALKNDLAAGGIGFGVAIGYVPGAKPAEVFQVYQLAAELQAKIFTHVREPNIISVQQAIADAMVTKAPLHVVHLNSIALGNLQMGLDMVQMAKKQGYEISTEVYPYTAASTMLNSHIFSEGWQDRLGISYENLQWVATGERLNKETFEKYRKTRGTVIIHHMRPEWIKAGVSSPGVIIASDGMTYAQLAHPRTAGTFSRVLGRYVREEKALSLHEALEKMTLLPALCLESIAPSMRFKGRLQVGMDADVTIFDQAKILDQATFEEGLKFSTGIEYVLVKGTLVLKNGQTVQGVFPGEAVYGKFKR